MSKNPVIIVPALGQSKLYITDANGNKIKNVWPFELDEKALLEEMKGSLMKMMLFRTDGGFSDKVAGIVDEITAPFALDENGENVNTIKTALSSSCYAECNENEQEFIKKVYPVDGLVAELGADKIFYFEYNFFGDVFSNAKSLYELIAEVKAKTGSEKVDFIVMSTGAAVFKAWIKQNSAEPVAGKVVFVTAFLDGASAVADIYEGKINLENPAALLTSMGGKAASLAQVVGMLPADVIENVISKSINVLRKNILNNCSSLWALIPVNRFDSILSKQKMTTDLWAKVSEIKCYTERIRENFKALEEKGVKFAFVCGKGRHLPEIFASADVDCDGIVDVSSASLGGAFEENTLYVDSLEHIGAVKNEEVISFVEKFLA